MITMMKMTIMINSNRSNASVDSSDNINNDNLVKNQNTIISTGTARHAACDTAHDAVGHLLQLPVCALIR